MPAPLNLLHAARETLAESLGPNIYFCSRVWEAWSYGTMSEQDFCAVVDDDTLMDELTQAVVEAILAMPQDLSGGEAVDQLNDVFLDTLGEVYSNTGDLNNQQDYDRISDDALWSRRMVFEMVRRVVPHTPHAEIRGYVAHTLREELRWEDLALLAAEHAQPDSVAWFAQAQAHLGDTMEPAHQEMALRLTAAVERAQLLQTRPASRPSTRRRA